MLGTRIITALIGIIIAIFAVNYGRWVFAGSVLALALLAWHEFANMMARREIAVSYLYGFMAIIFLWGAAWLGNNQETVAILLLCSFVVLVKMVLAPAKFALHDAVFTLAGVVYIGLTFSHLILLRFADDFFLTTPLGAVQAGAAYLWLAFIGTWAADTCAYFAGTIFGKHRLAPDVSPAKTWEGSAGGLVGSTGSVVLLSIIFKFSLLHCILIGLMIGLVAPLGDLVESAIKRYAGVKDSGRLLPGHGGVLDRFDSIMFTVPVVYYYIYIFFS